MVVHLSAAPPALQQTLFGCELVELIHEGPRSLIYRCRRGAGREPLVLKVAAPGSAGAVRTRELGRERDHLRALEGCSVVPALRGFEIDAGRAGLLLEDVPALSLDAAALAGTLSVDAWLPAARALAGLLGELHRHDVVHNDINPANVLIDARGTPFKLLDLGCAVSLADRAPPSSAIEAFRGPVAYMSPEATGRVGRGVDPRSDLYSLGVLLFELLTGSLPFDQDDARAVMHAHLARRAPRATDLVASVPERLSLVLQKLLAKDPDDRYPNAQALLADLDDAAAPSAREHGAAPSSRGPAHSTRRVYGRAAELAVLNQMRAQARSKTRVALLTGPAGAGKSTLLRAFAGEVARDGGYFGAGHFDTDTRRVPHDALARALGSLVTRVLAESEARLAPWKLELSAALGGTRSVLLELCPRISHLLAAAPARAAAPGQVKAQLVQATIAFLECCSSLAHGLCVSLDDLHWADADSLQLLEDVIAGSRSAPVFFLLACRGADTQPADEHVVEARHSDAHVADTRSAELERWLERLGARVPLERVALGPLSSDALAELIAQHTGHTSCAELAEIVAARTHGNPLFARAFLDALGAEGLLASGASPDLERINRLGVTENVGVLLAESLARLPLPERESLATAARIGAEIDTELLEHVLGRTLGDTLANAVSAGLLLPLGNTESSRVPSARRYRFAHDLVRRASLASLADSDAPRAHLAIGRALAAQREPEALGDAVFEVARHLNAAAALLAAPAEREELVRINGCAARAALTRAAAAEALQFAEAGVAMLAEDAWSERQAATRDLYMLAAEAAFESAQHDALSRHIGELSQRARTPLDAARACWWRGRVLQAQSRSRDAIDTFAAALTELGLELNRLPSADDVSRERAATEALLAEHGIEGGGELRVCALQPQVMAAELLSKLVFFAYADLNPILPIVICQLVRLSLEHGNTPESANGYTFYGLLLALEGDHERAARFGQLALRVAEHFGDATILSQTYLYTAYLLLHWRTPLSDLTLPLERAYRYGAASGSPLNTACSATTLCICRFWSGAELGRLAQDLEPLRTVVVRYRQTRILNWHEVLMQLIENLRSERREPVQLSGPFYDARERTPEHLRQGDKTALFNANVAQMLLCHLFGDHEGALACATENAKTPPLFASSLWAVPVTFMSGLCQAQSCRAASGERRDELLATGRETLRRLAALLPHNPREVEHKVALLQAEMAWAEGDLGMARAGYGRALELSLGVSSPLDQALIAEAACRFELSSGDSHAARRALRLAHRAYLRWGAAGKARALEREFPAQLRRSLVAAVSRFPFAADARDFDYLDLASVLAASQALSSELDLDRLLERLMTLLIEAAGAQLGYLLSRQDNEWVVDAARSAEHELKVLAPGGVLRRAANGAIVPSEAIVNYVARTGEAILLQPGAAGEALETREALEALRRDPASSGSVLCLPVKHQGSTLAIAYLENRLSRNAFSENTLRVLEMLAAQAAVSLQNARLYEQLEQRVVTRTRELRDKNEELAGALRRLMDIQRRLVTQEKLAALGALAGGVAHEIKNPLNFIINFAQSAGRLASDLVLEVDEAVGSLPARKQDSVKELCVDLQLALEKVVEHGSRATNIVNAMSLHARAGGERQNTDLNSLVSEALNMVQPPHGMDADDIPIVADLDGAAPRVMVVVQDLVRVILNLVTNSLHAVQTKQQAHGPAYSPRIVVSTRHLGNATELRVRDNGSGVPEKIRDQIFVPFFTTKPTGQGTGLGLSMSHDIVVRGHGGNMRFDSVEGEYTEFVVTLPIRAQGEG